MARYVIAPDTALYLAERAAVIAPAHQLVAPTLLRSQVLAILFTAVRQGALTRKEADRQLDYLRAQRIRLLGDRVLQASAWRVAEQLGWKDTFVAEYIALTRLQADAFVTMDAGLARQAESLVPIAAVSDIVG